MVSIGVYEIGKYWAVGSGAKRVGRESGESAMAESMVLLAPLFSCARAMNPDRQSHVRKIALHIVVLQYIVFFFDR